MKQQTIAAAINAAMAPIMAQLGTLRREMEDLKSAEMEIEDDESEASAPLAAGGPKKTRKLRLLKRS